MGLDFSHCEACWGYGGFMIFRKRVAASIGIDLDAMVGFGGSREWPSAEKEPLVYLLNHSDCDGHLTPKQCKVVAPRLLEIIDAWPDADYKVIYDKAQAKELAKGMTRAAAAKVNLRFC
jgi:hypothetical protein